jgi:hypothetical protein
VSAFRFGNQLVTTVVSMMAPVGRQAIEVDVVDYMWEPAS